jgi:hypothetical protein
VQVNRDSYPSIIQSLASFAKTLLLGTEQLDLSEMRRINEQFQAEAPILEPTAYRNGGDLNLQDQAEFLRLLEEFVTGLHKLDRR